MSADEQHGPPPGYLAELDQRACELRDILDGMVQRLREHDAECVHSWCGMSQIISDTQENAHPDCTAELLGYAVHRLAQHPEGGAS